MKFLSLIAVAITLLAAPALAASPARPSHDVLSYAVIGGNEQFAVFMPNSVASDGDHATVWVGTFQHDPHMFNGKHYDVIWFLHEFDCKDKTMKLVYTEVEDLTGNDGVTPTKTTAPPEAVPANAPITHVMELACGREEALFISNEDLVKGLEKYRATPANVFKSTER